MQSHLVSTKKLERNLFACVCGFVTISQFLRNTYPFEKAPYTIFRMSAFWHKNTMCKFKNFSATILYFTVWKLLKFILTLFWQKYRESIVSTKEVSEALISRNIFSVRVNFLFFHTVQNWIYFQPEKNVRKLTMNSVGQKKTTTSLVSKLNFSNFYVCSTKIRQFCTYNSILCSK